MSMKKLSGVALAAAAALAFSTAAVSGEHAAADAGKVNCEGGNACKGHSACKTANNACKGQNACKGKGMSEEANQKACDAAKAKNKAAK